MNSVLRPVDNLGHIGRTYLENNNARTNTIATELKKILQNAVVRHEAMHEPFPKQALVFTCLQHKSSENTEEKGAISPLPTVFSTCLEIFLPFSSNLKLSSANTSSLEEFEICSLGI